MLKPLRITTHCANDNVIITNEGNSFPVCVCLRAGVCMLLPLRGKEGALFSQCVFPLSVGETERDTREREINNSNNNHNLTQ